MAVEEAAKAVAEAGKATFLGLTAEGWTAAGTFGLFLATGVLAGITVFLVLAAREEIKEVRAEARKNRTLDMIGKYDYDPVIDRYLRRMAWARDRDLLKSEALKFRLDIVGVLNYLEGIAIGVNQGIYIEEMVRDFMEPIIRGHVEEVVNCKILEQLKSDPADFEHVFALNKKWDPPPPQPRFRENAQ